MNQTPAADADHMVDRLAQDYGKDLVRFISKRIRTSADARDLAQEAYVRLLRLDSKELIREPRPYLYRIAANILFEYELKRKAEVVGLMRWSDEHRSDQASGQEDADVETLTLRKHLEAAVAALSPKCRAVLILHRREGMTYEEIGRQIGISTSMVKKYLTQGLQHCREQLKDFR